MFSAVVFSWWNVGWPKNVPDPWLFLVVRFRIRLRVSCLAFMDAGRGERWRPTAA